ncbi:hypothetical protein C8J57DRAFT_1269081 [Mycena rebaudengoi]|nr:hypothetical protein C8J57DRAFT_1269081 [Mycena rebaudengoi]
MTTVPAPSLQLAREEWSDADFDLADAQSIHAVTDRDDDHEEDWDMEMDQGNTGGPAFTAQAVSAPPASQVFFIRPSQAVPDIDDDDDDEGVSTIKVAVLPRPAAKVTPQSPIDEDFEDAFSLPSDLTQLSLAPLSLNHRVSKTSLEWGDKDQTSSSQSSDAYSSLGFADASPSSNSTSSVSLPGTEDEDDDDDEDELEGLVIPSGIFESGKGARHLTKILEMKKKALVSESPISRPEEDDFETGLIIDDDFDLSPSRLLTNQHVQSQRVLNARCNSLPAQRRLSSSLRPSRLKLDRAKSPHHRLSYLPKPGNLRGQKSHSGLKPPTPPSNPRQLTRKASLSSLMETSSNQASGSGLVSAGTSKAGYEEPTAASRAKSYKYKEFKVPPTRPSTPSTNPAALRLTMPTASRSKSRPALSAVFNGPSSASGSQSPLFRSMTFGDGTELDGIDDLPTDRDKESQYRVQPKGYGNRVPGGSYPSKTSEKGTIRRKRRDGSEGSGSLDSNSPLGPSTNFTKPAARAPLSPKSLADPPKKKRTTSSPTAPYGKKKPTLIRNLGNSGAPRGSSIGSPVGSFANGARIVGNMIFDPARMCWISTLPPDEDEPDVFANLADDEEDGDDTSWENRGGTIRASVQLASTATPSATPSPARSTSYVRAASESGSERGSRASMVYDVDQAFFDSCRLAEERHRAEMKGWSAVARPADPFIRELATRKYT